VTSGIEPGLPYYSAFRAEIDERAARLPPVLVRHQGGHYEFVTYSSMVASVQRNNHSQLAGEAVNLGPRAEWRPGPYPMNAADARFIGKHDAQMPLASRCRSNWWTRLPPSTAFTAHS
jgi:hypothetical protein